MSEEKTWSVYRHTFPNGKVYIGVSVNPEERWDNGMGYADNRPMFRDIVFYGWRNIAHEILFSGLTEIEAFDKEKDLIASYGKNGREKTYNRQHADYIQPEKRKEDWLDLTVTEETLSEYRWKFCYLDDYWLETYIQQMDGVHPLGEILSTDGIEINFYHSPDKTMFIHDVLKAKYPKSGMTFREIYEWLNTAPKMEKIRVETHELTDEIKAMIGD